MTRPLRADVLVVGGGAAGVAAACAAADAGAEVVLIERLGFLGGMATAALVGTVCGLFTRSERVMARPAMSGFPRAFGEALASRSGTAPMRYKQGLQFLTYAPLAFRTLCDDWLAERGVRVCLHTTATGLHGATGVDALMWQDRLRIDATAIVDTSGVGVVAAWRGVPMQSSGVHQAPAFVFGVAGLPDVAPQAFRMGLLREMVRGVKEGIYPEDGLALSVVPGTFQGGRALLKLGLRGVMDDAPTAVAALEVRARRQVVRIVQGLRRRWPDLAVTELATQVGVRTGRRPRGDHVLTEAEVMGCAMPSDAVAAGAWPIEVWGPDSRPVLDCFDDDGVYGIPVGCLTSRVAPNLFFAGRALSATDRAIASARVIGTCLGTGYAAGALAAAHAAGASRTAAVRDLRTQLLG